MPNTASKLIRVGHSPDADDAFMFYALAKKKIPMRGFEVEHVIEDIESLNQRALRGELEVTAVSCHAYAYLADRYAVMRSGASIGDQYGPILVQRTTHNTQRATEKKSGVAQKKIAIPGKLTTAYLTLRLYSLTVDRCALRGFEPVFLPFDKIIDAVKNGEVDLGLVIHEGQITYAEHDLEKVLDLGAWWHEKTKLPLPLGVDIIRRDLGKNVMRSFAGLFKESIEYALSHRQEALEYALQFGRGISEDLNDRFVAMYVNDRTVDIGKDGEAGFRKLLDEAYQVRIIPKKVNLEFI
ncbi:MAG: MqnA/MqnD/SBP family protein [Candidatus Omnitrophota bacterium]